MRTHPCYPGAHRAETQRAPWPCPGRRLLSWTNQTLCFQAGPLCRMSQHPVCPAPVDGPTPIGRGQGCPGPSPAEPQPCGVGALLSQPRGEETVQPQLPTLSHLKAPSSSSSPWAWPQTLLCCLFTFSGFTVDSTFQIWRVVESPAPRRDWAPVGKEHPSWSP